ncbi:MAG: hypothetical protein H7222_00135 [Methylotenera sp.]|nr:hypothetical protein [Oligoflexia bacterium]
MSDEKSKKFSIDVEQTGIHEMPSVTQLLNRKTLGLPPAASRPPTSAPSFGASSPASQTSSFQDALKINNSHPSQEVSSGQDVVINILAGDMTFELESSGPSQSALEAAESQISERTVPEVRKTSRISAEGKLISWVRLQLKQSSDPMGKSLWTLIEKSSSQAALKSALFLSAQTSGAKTFAATASFEGKDRSVLWAGMVWDPVIVPELWTMLLKLGSVELSPPSQVTDALSDRNVVRGAFGIQAKEWLTLVRIGSADSCRGVLALTSDASLQSLLRLSMAGFGAALAVVPAKKAA